MCSCNSSQTQNTWGENRIPAGSVVYKRDIHGWYWFRLNDECFLARGIADRNGLIVKVNCPKN